MPYGMCIAVKVGVMANDYYYCHYYFLLHYMFLPEGSHACLVLSVCITHSHVKSYSDISSVSVDGCLVVLHIGTDKDQCFKSDIIPNHFI